MAGPYQRGWHAQRENESAVAFAANACALVDVSIAVAAQRLIHDVARYPVEN